MKAWITKYALTKGILVIEGEPSNGATDMFVGSKDNEHGFIFPYFHGEGKEWHRTPEAAVQRAIKMKADRLHSLHRSIAKLEKKSFSAVTADIQS